MPTAGVAIGARFQKAFPPHKIYRVVATIKRDSQPQHVRLVAEIDQSQVITVSTSALLDRQLWLCVD